MAAPPPPFMAKLKLEPEEDGDSEDSGEFLIRSGSFSLSNIISIGLSSFFVDYSLGCRL